MGNALLALVPHLLAAADCLARGAKVIQDQDIEQALTMLYDAVDIYENDDRTNNAAEVFRWAPVSLNSTQLLD